MVEGEGQVGHRTDGDHVAQGLVGDYDGALLYDAHT